MPSKTKRTHSDKLRLLKNRIATLNLPGSAKLRSAIETIAPRSSYKDDFPSSRWPLMLLGGLSTFIGVVLVWSLIARSQISVSSQGRLRPSQSPTVSRSQANSSSEKIFVKEGDLVEKGQPIMQLDDQALKDRLVALENKYAKSYVLLKEISRNTKLDFPADLPNPQVDASLDRSVLLSSIKSFESQKEKVSQLSAQRRQVMLKLKSLEKNVELQELIVDRYTRLATIGAVSELQSLSQTQKLSDLKSEFNSTSEEQVRLESALRDAEISFSGRTNDDYSQQLNALRSTQAEITSTNYLISNSLLRAPVAGYVFKLAVNVPGVPVSPGEELFQIVPSELLNVSVDVTAAQIGFIQSGMEVDVHIDSYPSSTYGVMKGKVVSVGKDSVAPRSSFELPTYSIPVEVELGHQALISNGKLYPLKPGMTARVSFNLRSVSVFQRLFDATSSILNPPPDR